MVAPHGPTFFPGIYLGAYFERELGIPYTAFATPILFKVPYSLLMMSLTCNIRSIEPKDFASFFKEDIGPAAIYAGGFDDVFDNVETPDILTINVNVKSALFVIACKYNRNLIPTLVLNECDIFTHSDLMVKFCKYVHTHFIRVGIPFPPISGSSPFRLPSLMSNKKMLIIYGKPLSNDNPDTLTDLYTQSLRDLHKEATDRGYTNKQLCIKLKGSKL